MNYVIRPLQADDEPILWEMLYQGLSSRGGKDAPPRTIVHQPEFEHYVESWGRDGDTGFVAHDKNDGSVLGAVWLRQPAHGNGGKTPPELAFAVKQGHRGHGIGSALLTQLVRSNPEASTISIRVAAGKPVLRLYERFGFKVVEERPDAIVIRREV